MSKITQEQLHLIVTKAALNAEYRKLLETKPEEALRTFIEFDAADLALLKTLGADLQRFTDPTTALDERDAKSWAIGICRVHIQYAPSSDASNDNK